MAKYRVVQKFEGEDGQTWPKGAFYEGDEKLADGYLDAGWIEEITDDGPPAEANGDTPVTPGYTAPDDDDIDALIEGADVSVTPKKTENEGGSAPAT